MDKVIQLVNNVPPISPEKAQYMIDHACRVDKLSFKVFVILLAVIAILASSARLIFRYRGDRTLHLEDYLVGFASICLVIETGLLYDFNRVLYMIDGATLHKPVLAYIGRDPELTKELLDSGPSTLVAYFTLGWLAIWAIKYSFLALFYKMLRNVSRKLTAYFWCTVAATGMSGVVVILESFILCPHFGADAAKCFLKNNYTFSISSGVVVQTLDIVTDLMIVSIPLILLKMSRLRLEYKFRIAAVLCLSLLCVILSIVRLAGGIHRNVFGKQQFGMTWISFMLHCEATVAVLTGSVPALRAIYTSRQNRKTPLNSEDEKSKSLKSRAMTMLSSVRKTKETLPTQEKQPERVRPRASIARWRQSIVGIIPRRAPSNPSQPVPKIPIRKDSAESAIIHPGLAYHDFRKQEKNGIHVTYETTVSSESAYTKSIDLTEASSQAGTVISAPNSPDNFDSFAFPEPVVSSRRVDYMIDEQFGKISAGMHV